jgi:mono/diheme cytochrome c family protein
MKTIASIGGAMILPTVAGLALGVPLLFAHSNGSVASDHDHSHHHHFAEFAKVPEKARGRRNPLESDAASIPAGRKLFVQHCAECHGETAEGGRKAPNLRAVEVQSATPGTLFWILSNGVVRRGMPVWSKLPEPERWQIVTFIKSLPPSTGAEMHPGHDEAHATAQKTPTAKQ